MTKLTLLMLLVGLAILAAVDIDPITRLILALLFTGYVVLNLALERLRRGAAWRSRYKK